MTSAPRDRPRVTVAGSKPAPSMPLGTSTPMLSCAADDSDMSTSPVGGRRSVGTVTGCAVVIRRRRHPTKASSDEGGGTGRDAQPDRAAGQITLRNDADPRGTHGDQVLVMVAEVGGVEHGAPDAARLAALQVAANLDVLRADRDRGREALVPAEDGYAARELRAGQ